ncbi:MAG: hypothetical protein Q4C47_03115, partial [Planctomycetia bacterium]|nr:hypothetical protein [Planctomycetia bacterium]
MYYREHLSPKALALLEAMQHLGAAYDLLVGTDLPPYLSTPIRVAMENLERESQRMQRDERNVIRAQMHQRLSRLREEAAVLEAILRHP